MTRLLLAAFLFGMLSFAQPDPLAIEILNWLPPGTQSFVFVSQPFRGSSEDATQKDLLNLQRLTVRSVIRGVGEPQPPWIERLDQSTIQRAAFAGWEMRPIPRHKGLGLSMALSSCVVVQLGLPDVELFATALMDLPARREQEATLYRYDAPGTSSENPPATTWIAMLSPSLSTICTDPDRLMAIVERRRMRSARVAMPPTLPEWKWVDFRAPLWGLRHFNGPRVFYFEDPKAIGLAFAGYNDQPESIHLTGLRDPLPVYKMRSIEQLHVELVESGVVRAKWPKEIGTLLVFACWVLGMVILI
ncbi:MAG: hypothetical protein SFV18_16630 [Bryobacteraceae bacterium]|nr:hypothetical protein [Bryobacteraceae bacterium]